MVPFSTNSSVRRYLMGIVGLFALLLMTNLSTFAHSTGMSGYTQAGCSGGGCHSSESSATSLSFSSASGNFTTTPGGTLTITFVVAHGSQSGAGADIAVKNSGGSDAGTLSPGSGSGLYLLGSELTHSSPKNFDASHQASFTFTWQAPGTPGTYTLRGAGNAVNLNGYETGDVPNHTSVSITVSATASIALNSPDGGEEWCPGSTRNITWTSSSITNVKIELSSDGGGSYPTTLVASTPASAGSWAWNIPASQPEGAQYKIRVSDASSAATNDVSNSAFSIKGPATITAQPTAQTMCEGQPVSLSVTASGAGLTYQWKKGGNDIAGKTAATLTFNPVAETDGGTYTVVVTGACGAPVTSSPAILTVRPKPKITGQPNGQNVCANAPATLTVTATGEGLTYQWRHDGNIISGITTPTLNIPTVTPADTGSYIVTVSGTCTPSVNSNAAIVKIVQPASIATQPQSATACQNQSLTLTVEAKGANLSYQWLKSGNEISGAVTASYVIPSVKSTDAGTYRVKVTGACNDVTSDAAIITIGLPPVISKQPANQTTTEGSTVNISVEATGTDITYQWYKGGNKISNATTAQYSIPNAKEGDSGNYICIVTNACGFVNSNAAKITVNKAGPGPVLTLTQSAIEFGTVMVGQPKEVTMVSLVKNTGTEALNVTSVAITGANSDEFTVTGGNAPFTLAVNETREMKFSFTPKGEGARAAILEFTANLSTKPSIVMSGTGAMMAISSGEGSYDFGTVEVSKNTTRTIIIKNSGPFPTRITSATIEGGNGQFTIISRDPELPATLIPNADLTLTVQFTPTAEGAASAQLWVFAESPTVPNTLAIAQTLLSAVASPSTSVRFDESLSVGFEVKPNPVSSTTVFSFDARKPGNPELVIMDMFGRTIRQFRDLGGMGYHTIQWDGRDDRGALCAGGTYRAVLTIGDAIQTVPVIVVR